ncbi:50S ribosomal protein L25 [Desulfovibrionales bacterium]
MAEQITLTVQKRSATGKGPNRRLRQDGFVPGIYYSATSNNISLQVQELPLERAWQQLGSNHIFQLVIENEDETRTISALIWKMQFNPLKKKIDHVDFYGVDLIKELKIDVPVVIVGEAPGVKFGGGVLEVYRDQLEILCLPLNIPDSIVLDVSAIQCGQSIHIKDIVLPEGVLAIFDENFAVVGVQHQEADENGSEDRVA